MARAFIHMGIRDQYEKCKAYFEVYGHTVVESGSVEVAIVDMDYGRLPAVEARIMVCISSRDYWREKLPAGVLFRLKPVDIDYLMDFVMIMLEEMI